MITKCVKCECEMVIGVLHDCVHALKAKAESLAKRANRLQGILNSDSWLAATGLGTYGPHTRGRSLKDRKTRPISLKYFESIVQAGKCLCCGNVLVFMRNPRGGSYHACLVNGFQCYYIGMDLKKKSGYELIVTVDAAMAIRKVG